MEEGAPSGERCGGEAFAPRSRRHRVTQCREKEALLGLLSPQTAKAAQTRCSNRKRLGGQASSTDAVFWAWSRWLCPAVAHNREKGAQTDPFCWRWWLKP